MNSPDAPLIITIPTVLLGSASVGLVYALMGMFFALWLLNHGQKAFKGFYTFVICLWPIIIWGQIVCSLFDWFDDLFGGAAAKLDKLLGKLTHGLVPAEKDTHSND